MKSILSSARNTACTQALCLALCLLMAWTSAQATASSVQSLMPASLTTPVAADAKSAEEIEYEVKAAFIFNFMRFIDWPEEKIAANRQAQKDKTPSANTKTPPPMIIGIVGKDPFRKAFTPILDRKIGDRPIELVHFQSYEPFLRSAGNDAGALAAYRKQHGALLARCDLLFFSNSEAGAYEKLLTLTRQSHAVTISDIADFAGNGGMIGFVVDNKRIRFDINLESVDREKIKIRSQLLELARYVHKKQDTKR